MASRYWAFVSYSHHDIRIAKWLIQALAKECVPRRYRDLVQGGGATFAQVFRDEKDAAAASRLADPIKQALEQSRTLIVVCSPFARDSQYVSEEIRYFISLGRADRILCLVASGVPNASDDNRPNLECFPEPLRRRVNPDGTQTQEPIPLSNRPLAANLGEESPDQLKAAIAQLTAGMLGISQGELDLLSRRRLLIRIGGAVATVVALLAIGLCIWDLKWREHIRHYRDWVRRDGIWHGVDRISDETASHLEKSYDFHYRGHYGRLIEVRSRNGEGNCVASGFSSVTGNSLESECSIARACSVKFEKTIALPGAPAEEVPTETIFDQFGNELEDLRFSGPLMGIYFQAQLLCTQGKTHIRYVKFEREHQDGSGFDFRHEFLDDKSEPIPNDDGEYGVELYHDEYGHLVRSADLGPKQEYWSNKFGIASVKLSYEKGLLVSKSLFDLAGAPTADSTGGSKVEYVNDQWGNLVQADYLDVDGNRVVASSIKVAEAVGKRGNYGNLISVRYFGPDSKPMINSEGCARLDFKVDGRGEQIARSCFDSNDKPTLDSNGVSTSTYLGNDNSRRWETSFLDVAGKPIVQTLGDARIIKTYDKYGHTAMEEYLNEQGLPVREKNWAARSDFVFSSDGKKLGVSFYDTHGNPTLHKEGYAGWHATFDELGNKVSAANFGKRGEPILDTTDGDVEIRRPI